MQTSKNGRQTISRDALRRPPEESASSDVLTSVAVGSAYTISARCTELAENTPYDLYGSDRLVFQMNQLKNQDTGDRATIRSHLDHLLRRMYELGASDIDLGGLASNGHIWYRIDGVKAPDASVGTYSNDETNLLILSLLTEGSRKNLIDDGAADFSVELPREAGKRRSRFRATCYFDSDYLALNLRAIIQDVRPIRSLNFHPSIERGMMFRYQRDGLTLITGVTGSGKSTTMDSIIDANNNDTQGHIVIIGKPIEFMHDSKKCIVRHREVGRDVFSFKNGIVQSLRQDPDIVVIGEMRDPSTISAALEITDSGHKVFSTLHTSSALESIDRIIAEYPPTEQSRVRDRLADVLRCTVSQKLCPKVGGGRILAKEVMWMTSSARAAIKNNNIDEIYQMMWEGWSGGQITLEQDLFRLQRQGLITPETAVNYANNKRRYMQLAK